MVLLSSFQRPRTLAPSLRASDRLCLHDPACCLALACFPALLRPADDRLPSAPLDCPASHPSSRFRGRASYRACRLRVKLLVLRLLRAPRRSPSRAQTERQGRRCLAKAIRRVNFPRSRRALTRRSLSDAERGTSDSARGRAFRQRPRRVRSRVPARQRSARTIASRSPEARSRSSFTTQYS